MSTATDFFSSLMNQARENDRTVPKSSAVNSQQKTVIPASVSADNFFTALKQEAASKDFLSSRTGSGFAGSGVGGGGQAGGGGGRKETPAPETLGERLGNLGTALGGAILSGADAAATGISSTADFLLGRPLQALGWEDNPITALNEKLQTEREQNTEYFTDQLRGDKLAGGVYNVGTQVSRAAWELPLIVMTGAANKAAQAGTKGLQATAALETALKGGGVGQTVANAVNTMQRQLRNPQVWQSFASTTGQSYEDAKAGGASEASATAYAVINGLLGSLVEVGGGGIQELPDVLRQPGRLRNWIDTMLDEGKEEVVQGVIDRLTQNVTGVGGNAIFGTGDTEAVFNPNTALEEFGMGALVGGILGGGQIAVDSALNRIGRANNETPSPMDESVEQFARDVAEMNGGNNVVGLLPEQSEIAAAQGLPMRVENAEYRVVEIPQEKIAEIEAAIDSMSNADARKKYKSIIRNLFGGQRFKNVNTVVNELMYEFGIGSKGIGEIIARQPVNAQTFAMLERLNEVVENAKYIASEPTSHPERRGIHRTDIFETPVQMGERQGTARMRVNVSDNGNNLYYATYKNNEGAPSQPSAGESRQPGVESDTPSNDIIPNSEQSVNTSEIPNSSPAQDVNTPVMPDSSAVSPESSVGAMARGATVGHTPTYAENQEHALEGALGEQYEGPGVHEVLPNQDSMFYAQQRLDADYEGEVSDLRNKQEWDAVDTDVGFLILQQLSQKAMESNSETDISALRDWSNLVRSRATTAGQTLQAYSKWRQFTPESAYADAVDILYGDNVREGMTEEQKQTILQETKNASERLESIAPEDVESTIDLIKSLSQQRRTTGLLRNDTSDVMNTALQQVAQQEGGAEFLRSVAQSQIRRLAEDYERVSFTERMRTLRALNMLSKPATTLRNLVGNTVFDPLESISNNTGLAFDWLLSLYTGQRTTAMDKSWFSEAKRRGSVDALMRSIIEVGLDADATGATNRYEQGGGRTFRMTGNFIERLLSTWEKFNGYALTSTDEFAKGGTRAEAERGLRELAERDLLVDAQEAQAEQRQRGRNILAPGTVVRALDRNNFGHVVAYDPTNDSYLVHFESREGAEADVELPASQVVDTKAAGRARRRLTGGRDSGAAQRAQLSTDDYITQRADQIARERTFQNDSIASDVTLGLRDVGNIIHVGDIGAGDILIPFARVPANVATQAINYSPVGLANGLVQMARVLRAAQNGTLTPQQQAAAVTSVGRGLAGTTGIAMFAALALNGILNVAGADDDDERAFDTGEGLSGTQLNLSALERWISGESTEWQDGDTLLNIGFLEPINAQMAMGSMIADSYLEDGTLSAYDVLNASVAGTMQSIIDLPAMSSIQELQDAWKYASGDDDTDKVLNAALSYAGSQATSFAVPNIVAGVAAGLDNTVRAPYVGETPLEDMMYQFMNDIPDFIPNGEEDFRRAVPERLDSWGNERQYTDSDILNFLNNTVLPGSLTQYKTSDINQELRRLGADALPQNSAPDGFTIDGERIALNQEQKDAYQQAYGEAALSSLEGLIGSGTYQSLSDADKLKVVESVYDYANAIAKQSIDSRYELEGASAKAAEYDNPGEYFMFNEALKNIEDSKGADTAAFDAVMEDYANMDTSEQNALMEMLGENTRFDDVVEAFEAGISPEEWYDAYDEYKALSDDSSLNANARATEFAKWLDTESGFTDSQQGLLEEQLGFYTQLRANSDRYDALVDAGFAPEKADAVYDAVSALEPLPGKTQVSNQQRYEAIVGTSGLTDDELVAALTEYEGAGSEKKQKFKTAYAYGISPEKFVAFLGLKEDGVGDADGNGSYKADETTALVDAFLEMYPDASRADAALLWAMTNKSKSGNPFANFNQDMIEWDITP